MLRNILRKKSVDANTSTTSEPRPPSIGKSDIDRVPHILPGSSAISEENQVEKPQMCLSVAIVIFALTVVVC